MVNGGRMSVTSKMHMKQMLFSLLFLFFGACPKLRQKALEPWGQMNMMNLS